MKRAMLILFVVGFSTPAYAHIQLDFPEARTSDQKTGPCGAAGSTRGNNVTTFEVGETIEIKWRETINHPGHYRIAFDADGQDDFVDPASFDDFDTNSAVMLDNISDKDGGAYTQTITLPDAPCASCTLQIAQIMTDKAPYGDGNDLYYQCADIEIVAAVVEEPDAGTSDDAGSDAGTDTDAGMAGGNNSTGNNSTNPPGDTTGDNPGASDIDDGFVDSGDSDADAACSTAGAAAVWPLAFLIVVGFVRRRVRGVRRAR